jgi:hypothetical protein
MKRLTRSPRRSQRNALCITLVSALAVAGFVRAADPVPMGEIESVEPVGQLIRECTLPGHTRRDDVVPRAANAIQLSATRWMVIYSTHGYRGVDDERSIIYQVRRDAPDGAVLKEEFFARGEMDWKVPGLSPLADGNVYYKQHGHMVAFGVPKGALVGGKPAPHANLFVAKWRVSARPIDVKTGFMTFQKLDRTIGQRVDWVQFRLNDREDDIEIVQPVARLRQKGFETGDAFCSAKVGRMNQSFCVPVPASDDCTEWADANHFDDNRVAALKYRFNPESHRYEWIETGPMVGGDPKRTLIEASLVRLPDEWIVAGRGIGEIGWARSKDPFAALSPLIFTQDPPGHVPMTVYRCPDGVMRLFCNDIRTNPTRHIRDPLFCWDVAVSRGFATSNRREIFSVARGNLPIRAESHAKIDFPHLFPLQGRTQLVVHGVSMRAMNFPTEGNPGIPLQNAAEKDAAGLYYSRITYRQAPPASWQFGK